MAPYRRRRLGSSARILVVEDEAVLAEQLGQTFAHDGHAVAVARTLAEARRALAAGPPPDLVLLDLGLPDGDGLRLIPPLARTRPVPPAVLVVSGQGGDSVVQALELGARTFVQKPVRLFELRARVDAALRDRRTLARLDNTRRRAAQIADHTARIQRATAALSRAVDARAVAATLLSEGRDLLNAVAGSVGLLSADGQRMTVIGSFGFPDSGSPPVDGPLRDDIPGPRAIRLGRPVFAGDSATALRRFPGLRRLERILGEVGVGAAPLVADGRTIGAISFRFPPGPIPRSTRQFLALMGDLGGQALDRARLHELETAARARAEVLAAAGALLADAGDHRTLIQRVAELAVPRLADLCVVDAVEDPNGPGELLAIAGDPAAVRALLAIRDRAPLRRRPADSAHRAAAERRPQLVPVVDAARRRMLAAGDDEYLRLLDEMGDGSAMSVPMVARGRVIGVLSLLVVASGRRYGPDDLAAAEELARRCALAIENDRLRREAEHELEARRVAETALRESEERFRRLADDAPDVVFRYELRPTARYAYVSPAIEAATGYRPEEVGADPAVWLDIVHPDDHHLMADRVGRPERREPVLLRWVHRESGEVRWFETHYRRVHDEHGDWVAVEGIARDVTERRKAEESRRELDKALALLAERERIAMELHDGVVQALFGTVLRLGAVSRTLANHPDARAALGETVDHLNGVIADVRAYVNGLEQPTAAPGRLRQGLAAIVEEHRGAQACVDLSVARGVESIEVALEPRAVSHVLQVAREAVSNAVRHAGAARVAVELHRCRGRLVVEVSDDGVGLPAGRRGDGPGHGLRNMSERARLLGGRLSLRPRPGGGTVVRLEVPLVREPAD